MAETATRREPRRAAREAAEAEPSFPPLQVRYYRHMKPGRVHELEVSFPKAERRSRGDAQPVTVRLLAAGAQVLPTEQTLDAADPQAKAVFYVTPLGKGWLKAQRLELLIGGRKVQEIPLGTKVVSQCATWALLIASFLIPWALLAGVKYSPLAEDRLPGAKIANFIEKNVPDVPEFVANTGFHEILKDTRTIVADQYQVLWEVSREHPLAFYSWIGLLFLTALSAWLNRAKRKWARGKPIPLSKLAE